MGIVALFMANQGNSMTEKKKPYANLFSRWLKSPWPVILALLFTTIYFTLGEIIELVLPYTKYKNVPDFMSEPAANYVRPDISYPISDWFDMKGVGRIILIPYYLIIGYLVALAHLLLKPWYKYILGTGVLVVVFLRIFPGTLLLFDNNQPSISYGKSSNGSIEFAKRLPYKSDGYVTYSFTGYLAGRTFVHEKLKLAVLEAFELLSEKYNERQFVIGDCGLKEGGPMSFVGKEKQNGLEMDFMLPIVNLDGSAYQKQNITNYWNYDLDFDETGRLGGMEVDYGTLATMLATLQSTAIKHGLTIKKIEMHPDIKRGLLGKDLKSLIKNILGGGVKNDIKSAPAYFSVVFEITDGKGRNFLQRILKGKSKGE
ncbi:MAG: penicillin-insensitive murein endopeptidase [Bacteroidia bacterium]